MEGNKDYKCYLKIEKGLIGLLMINAKRWDQFKSLFFPFPLPPLQGSTYIMNYSRYIFC